MQVLQSQKTCRMSRVLQKLPFSPPKSVQRVSRLRCPQLSAATASVRLHSNLLHRGAKSLQIQPARRTYATSQMTDVVFPDPNRPDLFYHLVNAPNPVSQTLPAYALSFLNATPPSVTSATILGWLPAQSNASDASGTQEQSSGLGDFRDNPKFLALLHTSIKSGLVHGVDDIWINSAIQYQNGWMHIHDQRNIPALDRIGDSEDIIASIFVENGKMNVQTYEPMPSYRICTSDGITQLTPGLAKNLHDDLTKLRNEAMELSGN